MRLQKLQKVLKEKGFPYTYVEEDGCGSVNFEWFTMCGNSARTESGELRQM